MKRITKTLLLPAIVLMALLLAACFGSDEGSRSLARAGDSLGVEGPPGLPGIPGGSAAQSGAFGAPQQPAQPMPAAAATPAPSAPSGNRSSARSQFEALGAPLSGSAVEEAVASLVAQQRIIVRTVDMTLVVDGVPAALDGISSLAQEFGGWVVSSDRSQRHQGTISLRVPADRLDEAILRLRQLAVEVESEVSTSKDVTDEYVDTSARLTNLQATQQALISLLERAANVTEALSVQ
ncbi:MAG: DUF4349 domain-containing protein, partial [Chloroflexi bacterium]|nr:DUF4349 domain-containing protein [Chloroflexota bacterium]